MTSWRRSISSALPFPSALPLWDCNPNARASCAADSDCARFSASALGRGLQAEVLQLRSGQLQQVAEAVEIVRGGQLWSARRRCERRIHVPELTDGTKLITV